ncbi:MAG: 4Fe-4S binding protein [Candidatus Omnitrophica bacterium]|jgi:polyferredoxin|nr:4Fe-4S binding protein [Candidatus Omnitrophota bacterium]MDD5654201.1 4Fe-4S binding protein [Candidatus Omnitrophota bacterium]
MVKAKKTQVIMVWLLPLIIIGGLFYPLLGYLVVAMIAALLMIALFKGRYWCWNLCPRGAFLDIALSKVSANRPIFKSFAKQWFRWLVVVLFMGFLAFRIVRSGGSLIAVGSVFVGMCVLTTVISIILGVTMKHRSWCAVCPMGTIQEKIGKIAQLKKPNDEKNI